MPVAAEVGLLLLGLHHLEDVRKAFEAGDERVMARLAEVLPDIHEIRGLELLVADHQHRVLEERLVHLAPSGVIHPQEVHAADLGAERPGERMDVHGPESSSMIGAWLNESQW